MPSPSSARQPQDYDHRPRQPLPDGDAPHPKPHARAPHSLPDGHAMPDGRSSFAAGSSRPIDRRHLDGHPQADGHPRADGHAQPDGSSRHDRYLPDGHGSDPRYSGKKTFVDGDASPTSSTSSKRRRVDSSSSNEDYLTASPEDRSRPVFDDIVDGGRPKLSKRVRRGEDNLTVRRREANRLAAQRFRSRKKGYQDSLEDRIKTLEHEKELLTRQVDEFGHIGGSSSASLQDRSSGLRFLPPDGHGADHMWARSSRTSHSGLRSTSPDRREAPVDAEVRIASLESANRRLQEEVRGLYEENEQLREELRWRRDASDYKGRRTDHMDGIGKDEPRWRKSPIEPKDGRVNRLDEDGRRHHLPPLDVAALSSGAYPTPSASYTTTHSRDSDSRSELASPGIQLAPLRWPPPRAAGISTGPPIPSFAPAFDSARPSNSRRSSQTFDNPR